MRIQHLLNIKTTFTMTVWKRYGS